MGAFKFAKTVLKSTFKKPATLMYPVVEREWQERTRGSIDIDADKCILCGICGKKMSGRRNQCRQKRRKVGDPQNAVRTVWSMRRSLS